MPTSERAIVIYNASAGGAEAAPPDEVLERLRVQGYAPTCHPTESEDELDSLLPDVAGLVVTCGGDGTLSAVLERVAGREDVEVAHLPLGTANNLGHALHLPMRSLDALADLRARPRRPLDLGVVDHGGGRSLFSEGFGCGLYAELLHAYDPQQGKSVARAVESLVEVMAEFEPTHVRAWVDGRDVSGDFLVFGVLNTPRIGPRLELASSADPHDGRLDVVALEPASGPALVTYLQALARGEVEELEGGSHWRAERVALAPNAEENHMLTFHLDTVTYDLHLAPASAEAEGETIEIRVHSERPTVVTGPLA